MKKFFFVARVAIFFLFIFPVVRAHADPEKCDIGYWSYQDSTYVFDAASGATVLIDQPFHLSRAMVDSVANNRIFWHYGGREVCAMRESLVEHPALAEWRYLRAERLLPDFKGTFYEAVRTITLTDNDPIIARFLYDQIRGNAGLTPTYLDLPRSRYLEVWRGYVSSVLDECYSLVIDYD